MIRSLVSISVSLGWSLDRTSQILQGCMENVQKIMGSRGFAPAVAPGLWAWVTPFLVESVAKWW
jgi:hypothetical protein